MKENKTVLLIRVVFTIMGLIFLIAGLIPFLNMLKTDMDKEKTTGIISNISYSTYVKYEVNGKEYESSVSARSSNMRVGNEIKILYNPSNPYEISLGWEKYMFLIFPGIGAIFFIIGLSMSIYAIKKKRNKRYLIQNGNKVYADIEEVVINYSLAVNGRHPYVIHCKWKDPSSDITYLFKSENLWNDPDLIIEEKGLSTIPVYIDLEDPKKHYVSLENIFGEENDSKVIDLR